MSNIALNRFLPILFIWLTVATSIFELMSQLQLILLDLRRFLEVFVIVALLGSVFLARRQFAQDRRIILDEIQSWEPDMMADIQQFLKARKTRLLSSAVMVIVLLIMKFLFGALQPKFKEVFLYIFVIVLFHASLVSSLILFKISRTITWVRHENLLAQQEQA